MRTITPLCCLKRSLRTSKITVHILASAHHHPRIMQKRIILLTLHPRLLKEMEGKYEDDYTALLFTHPAQAKGNQKAPQPSGSFDRSIEKAQKAICIQSP